MAYAVSSILDKSVSLCGKY